jgi:hypothetical protein
MSNSAVLVPAALGIYLGLLAYDLVHDLPVLSGDTSVPIAFYTRGFASLPLGAFLGVATVALLYFLVVRLTARLSVRGVLQLALALVPVAGILLVMQPTHARFTRFSSPADELASMTTILYVHVAGFVAVSTALLLELRPASPQNSKPKQK